MVNFNIFGKRLIFIAMCPFPPPPLQVCFLKITSSNFLPCIYLMSWVLGLWMLWMDYNDINNVSA